MWILKGVYVSQIINSYQQRRAVMKKFKGVIIFVVISVLSFMGHSVASAVEQPVFSKVVGNNKGRFDFMGDVSFDSAGNIYILDTGNNRVQKFDPQGQFLSFLGGYGSDLGQLNSPQGIKVDIQGFVYVSDYNNKRIQKFDSSGNVVMTFNIETQPRRVDVDSLGNIYVTERGYLSKFDSTGNLIWRIDGNGSVDGQFNNANGMTIGSQGNIYVADTGNARIQEFSPNGDFVWSFNTTTNNAPIDVAIDNAGNFYIAMRYYWRIEKYDSQGNYVSYILGEYYVNAVAVDAQNYIYFVNDEDKLIKVDVNGQQLMTIGSNGSGPHEFARPIRLAKDSSGNVYVVDTLGRPGWYHYSQSWRLGNNRIRKLDHDGNIVLSFGQNGTEPGNFYSGPTDVVVDDVGNIYVVGNDHAYYFPPPSPAYGWMGLGTIQKFDVNGQFLWRSLIAKEESIPRVIGVSLNANNELLVSGVSNGSWHITLFSDSGVYLRDFVNNYNWYGPSDVEVDNVEDVLVNDTYSLMKFDPSGNNLFRIWSNQGAFADKFAGFDTDQDGNIWIADTYNHRVVCLSPQGDELLSFGSQGFGPAEFQLPYDVAIFEDRLFVSDSGNQRIQIFDFFLTVNIDIKPGSSPNTINLGSNGVVPVAILSSTKFDATEVDPLTVTLASAPVRLKGKGTPMFSEEDVDADGLMDLVVHVETEAFEINPDNTDAILEGMTLTGQRIKGTDTVRVVPE